MSEATMRASVILDEAHASASCQPQLPPARRKDLETELAYLRTLSQACRTRLRAYLESLTRGIDEWEHAEDGGARVRQP